MNRDESQYADEFQYYDGLEAMQEYREEDAENILAAILYMSNMSAVRVESMTRGAIESCRDRTAHAELTDVVRDTGIPFDTLADFVKGDGLRADEFTRLCNYFEKH